jgi:hypothetical protein
MFQMRHHILEDGIRDIADEQVMLRMPLGQQGQGRIRGFRHHARFFGVSDTEVNGFGVSDTANPGSTENLWKTMPTNEKQIRGFKHQDSGFQTPRFGVLNTVSARSIGFLIDKTMA